MRTSKYKATIIGLITVMIWLLIAGLYFLVPGILCIPLLTLITAIPFEFLSSAIFGANNYPLQSIGALSCEILLLVVLCIWYFRKMVLNERKGEEFDSKELIVFFTFLHFVLFPIGYYTGILTSYSSLPEDPFFMLFSMIKLIPYIVFSFVPIGLSVDLIRRRIHKRNTNYLNS